MSTTLDRTAYWLVTAVRVVDDCTLRVEFADGISEVVRFAPTFLWVYSHRVPIPIDSARQQRLTVRLHGLAN